MISNNLRAENASFSQSENTLPIQPDGAPNQPAAGSPIAAAVRPLLKSPESAAIGRVDERESLVNECKTGAIEEVALSQGMITRLLCILLDFDLDPLDKAAFPPGALDSPEAFYEKVLKPLLNREEVFRSAEVRVSGRGLHVIVRLAPSIEFQTATDRERWAAIVQLLQSLLPTDPCCPGITALTRPLGSVNGKNHKVVRSLREGQPVSPERVLELVERVRRAPFETICRLLHGGLTARPCPRCQKTGSQMRASGTKGDCYHCKSKLQIADLLKPFYNALDTRENGGSEVDHD